MESINDMPLISIVIPTYNHAHFIGRALQSVLNQTHTNWEAIVIDNYSQDNTDEVVGRFADPRITLLKIHNKGVIAASRNMGIRAAKGEWIAFLDSDDWWKPAKLAKASAEFKSYDCIYHNMYLVKKNDQFLNIRRSYSRSFKENVYEDLLENGNAILNSSLVVRKKMLIMNNYISESPEIISWEDYDTWLRFAKKSYRFKKLAGILGYYWIGGGNISNPEKTLNNIENFLKIYSNELKGLHLNVVPWWCSYTRALNLKKLKRYEDCHNQFVEAYSKSSSFNQKFRVIFRMTTSLFPF